MAHHRRELRGSETRSLDEHCRNALDVPHCSTHHCVYRWFQTSYRWTCLLRSYLPDDTYRISSSASSFGMVPVAAAELMGSIGNHLLKFTAAITDLLQNQSEQTFPFLSHRMFSRMLPPELFPFLPGNDTIQKNRQQKPQHSILLSVKMVGPTLQWKLGL